MSRYFLRRENPDPPGAADITRDGGQVTLSLRSSLL